MTRVRHPVIDGSVWNVEKNTPIDFRMISDGTVNTIMFAVAPADQTVEWLSPEAWKLDEENLLDSFFGDQPFIPIVMFDASVHRLVRKEINAEILRGLLTHNGNEPIHGLWKWTDT